MLAKSVRKYISNRGIGTAARAIHMSTKWESLRCNKCPEPKEGLPGRGRVSFKQCDILWAEDSQSPFKTGYVGQSLPKVVVSIMSVEISQEAEVDMS